MRLRETQQKRATGDGESEALTRREMNEYNREEEEVENEERTIYKVNRCDVHVLQQVQLTITIIFEGLYL